MTPYVPLVSPMSIPAIELDAVDHLSRHFPQLLKHPGKVPVLEFWESLSDYGLTPGVSPMPAGVEGMTWPDGRVEVSEETYRGAHAGNGRARFTMIHEAYHGIRHSRQIRQALVDTGKVVLHRKKTIKPYLDPEWQANTFASAFLMPRAMVLKLADQFKAHSLGLRSLRNEIVEVFGVSRQAAEIRMKKLDILENK